ncbi:hypothetical protein [Haloplanus aerogenes]|uniref:Exonuclease SbcC n=1 Tax=Haloplanus aerogenes TaxID=660522 RepID=A0A3M0CXV6_9EURY|nr:hypothetical protein [Haloplanus aerogenes]AZH24864.1 hypothetical protein DU502_05540 [Haloplanus aerogenes]RMB13931.1 hypothetical protein ATH50_2374 [Haloplanus aerogenes]
MTDADVRAALRALATDEQPAASPADYDAIDEATRALDDVRDAATFVDGGGLSRLRRAIERADRRGDRAAARRGRDALATIERCRRAAVDHF